MICVSCNFSSTYIRVIILGRLNQYGSRCEHFFQSTPTRKTLTRQNFSAENQNTQKKKQVILNTLIIFTFSHV